MKGDYIEPWSWIPHADGADRQQEINAHLRNMLDNIALAKCHPQRWGNAHRRFQMKVRPTKFRYKPISYRVAYFRRRKLNNLLSFIAPRLGFTYKGVKF